LGAVTSIAETQQHHARITPAAQVGEWLPWVHIVIGNLKAFLLGAFHGVSKRYFQGYLDESSYRFTAATWNLSFRISC